MTKQETYDYLRARGAAFEITEHKAVYNMEAVSYTHLMAEEGEGVSLPETNKREQSTETKEAVRTVKRKKKHHGMEL